MTNTSNAAEPGPVVIIHGAWGGAHHWKPVADQLTHEYGHTVRRASLTGLGERVHLASPEVRLTTHVQDVVNLIEFDDLRGVTLVAHSYGGAVATGVVDAAPERIARVVYLDAHLLDNGESYLANDPERLAELTRRANEKGDGWQIPVDWDNPFRDAPHPLRTLTEPLKLKHPVSPQRIASEYWLFTDGGPAEKDERYFHLRRAEQRGWPTQAFDWDHNPQRSRPAEVVQALQNFLRR